MFDVIQNRRVLFGNGKTTLIPELIREVTDKKILILAFSETAKCVADILSLIRDAGIEYILDTSLHSEPSTLDIDRIAARADGCGAVLAIGGGSVLDCAKAVAMLATNGGTVVDYQMNGKPIVNRTLPFFAVPTTSGTGSEASKVSVVYNPDNGLKKSFYSQYMIADTVILDPLMTVGLPESVTVSTGIDALSHAIESYVSLNATPYTEMFSMQAMRLVVKALKACVNNPHDVEARSDMALASYFGGCALNAGIGLDHIIAQPLGGITHIPHGVACAIFLPYAMEYNVEYATDKYCDIARVFGAEGENGLALAKEGIARVRAFLKDLNAPDSIRQYLPADFELEKAVDIVVGATGHIKCNPRPVDRTIIRNTISKVI
ncbi:MAG: iron-containing alcohol dehydrogenase [Clostridiales bacterium]|nr:iron-containing alcohol dehydrogenase [Clostridiales bacterium]